MPTIFRALTSFLLLSCLLILIACETGGETTISGPDPNGPPTVTIEMRNLSTDAWIVTEVQGASGVTDQGAENPTIRFTEGVRYIILNSAGRSAHPFALQDASGSALLRQDTGAGTLSDESDINFTADADGVAFTFTRSLSQEAATYNCLNHPAMEGTIVSVDSE